MEKCFLTLQSMQNYIPNSRNLTGIFHFFFLPFTLTQYISTKLTASELKKGWPEWTVSSFSHSSHSHISPPSVLAFLLEKTQVRNSVYQGPGQNELLLEESMACGLSSSLQGKGRGQEEGPGNVAEKWVRKMSLEFS